MDAAGDAPGKEKPNAIAGDATMDGADQAKLDGADQAKLANGLSEPSADSGENKKTSQSAGLERHHCYHSWLCSIQIFFTSLIFLTACRCYVVLVLWQLAAYAACGIVFNLVVHEASNRNKFYILWSICP